MNDDDFSMWLAVAVALVGALLLCNYPVCEDTASLCAIHSEASDN